jgi:hypothetical protein
MKQRGNKQPGKTKERAARNFVEHVKRNERPTSTSTVHAGDLKLRLQRMQPTKRQIAECAEAARSDE